MTGAVKISQQLEASPVVVPYQSEATSATRLISFLEMLERAPLDGPYLDVHMPERFELQFLSDRGEWLGEALCWARDFDRLEDGAYIYSGGGSGLWIRCVAHHDHHFEHVDGGGNLHQYRLLPRPPDEDEPSA